MLIVLGFYLNFYGEKYMSMTLFIAGSLATMGCLLYVFYMVILPTYVPTYVHYVLVVACAGFSLIVGFFAAMWVKLGLFIVGGWIGSMGGMILFNSLIAPQFGSSSSTKTLLTYTIVICVIIGGIITMYLFNHAIIVGSSVCGAYALVRGLSVFIGGYPNEILIYTELEAGYYTEMPGTFYGYLAAYVLLVIIGIFV